MDDGKLELVREHLLFLIKAGPMHDLVTERMRLLMLRKQEIIKWVKDIDPTAEYFMDLEAGCLRGMRFHGKIHPQFKKPNSAGCSLPKKGSFWFKQFASQEPMPESDDQIFKLLGIDRAMVDYSRKSNGECEFMSVLSFGPGSGFMWLGKKGPFGLWMVDIPSYVKELQERGFYVRSPTIRSLASPSRNWVVNRSHVLSGNCSLRRSG